MPLRPLLAFGLLAVLLSIGPAVAERYLDPEFAVDVTRGVAYGPLAAHRLDVYRPAGDLQTGRPAVLLIHGGGFFAGGRAQDLYVKMASAFAERGYVAYSIDYRLADPSRTPAVRDTAIADVTAALAWVRTQHEEHGIDPARIAIGGDSAGGNLAVSLAYGNDAAAGAGACLDLWGGMYSRPGAWDAPIHPDPVPAGAPPTLLIHGTADQVVPYQTSLDLVAQLEAAGVAHELFPLLGADHYPEERAPEFIAAMVDFVYRTVAAGTRATAVTDDGVPAGLPMRVALDPGFPNPFNATMTLSFGLPAADSVELMVCDLRGRVVARLVDGWLAAGPHQAHWNGRDDAGREVASGPYLFRLTTSRGAVETRKVTLLR